VRRHSTGSAKRCSCPGTQSTVIALSSGAASSAPRSAAAMPAPGNNPVHHCLRRRRILARGTRHRFISLLPKLTSATASALRRPPPTPHGPGITVDEYSTSSARPGPVQIGRHIVDLALSPDHLPGAYLVTRRACHRPHERPDSINARTNKETAGNATNRCRSRRTRAAGRAGRPHSFGTKANDRRNQPQQEARSLR